MPTLAEPRQDRLDEELKGVTEIRRVFAEHLYTMAGAVEQAEAAADEGSGQLGLEPVVGDLRGTATALENGTFRLMVLGDMKRGKSTFLNALLGENILPRDVNPCTAILTVLRYGERPGVTVHFSDGKEPRRMDVESFRSAYTIPPDEARHLAETGHPAFPDVANAVIELPLPLLRHGVEIIDSPGLNDTESLNELSLGYIRECHAILFVLNAVQPLTMGERRYLTNYIRDRGLTVFFIVNRWDEIAAQQDDLEDVAALAKAEERVRHYFRANLHEYCRVDGQDLYGRRVFEVSALQALRARMQRGSLQGTGFAAFMEALGAFLVHERAAAELGVGRTAARAAHQHVGRAVETRIPLLYLPAEELQEKIAAVEPAFRKLEEIRESMLREISQVRQRKVTQLSGDFHEHLLRTAERFPEEFSPYQPELKFFDFLRRRERERFREALEDAFGKYINDRVTEWSRAAEAELQREILAITLMAGKYAVAYGEVTHNIADRLVGHHRESSGGGPVLDEAPGWERAVAAAGAALVGDLTGVVLAGSGVFNWKRIATHVAGMVAVALVSLSFGVVLGPVLLALAGTGVGAWQTSIARKKLIQTMRKELEAGLPELAREGRRLVYERVDASFSQYMDEISERIGTDIRTRRAELDNLMARKREHEIDVRRESNRLRALERAVGTEREAIEVEYDRFTDRT